MSLRNLVGPPRFALGTSCTPSKRASQAAPRPDPGNALFDYRTSTPGLLQAARQGNGRLGVLSANSRIPGVAVRQVEAEPDRPWQTGRAVSGDLQTMPLA